MKRFLTLLSCAFLTLLLIAVWQLHFQVTSLTTVLAQEEDEEESPEGPSFSDEMCNVVGNNLAVPFAVGASGFTDGSHTLASLNGPEDIPVIINVINTYPGTVIVRAGASTSSLGLGPEAYRAALIQIAEATGKPFIAMATHNEPNGQENQSAEREVEFGKIVTTNFPNGNVTFISGQLDNYFNSDANVDNSRACEYIAAYRAIPNLKGISLPLYTTPNFLTGEAAFALFQRTVACAAGYPIYITESGPYADYTVGIDSEFEEYIKALQLTVASGIPKAILLFNALGLNDDPAFAYTAPFWEDECRQMLQTECSDTETILEVCDGSGFSRAGNNSCKSYCRGNFGDPCAQTPGNDCSIPYPAESFLTPRDQLVDLEREGKTYEDQVNYLEDYLKRTTANKGLRYKYNASMSNHCLNPEDGTLSEMCEDVGGGGTSQIGVENTSISLLSSLQTARKIIPDRLGHSRQAINAPTGDRDQTGATQKLTDGSVRMLVLADLANFKLDCYNSGKVIEDRSSQYFKDIRCMNFQDYSRGCTGCHYKNEKELWTLGIPSCMALPYTTSQNHFEVNRQCNDQMKVLRTRYPEDHGMLLQSTDIPVARRPIFGGIDELAPQANHVLVDILQQKKTKASKPENKDNLKLVNTEDTNEEQGELFTSYYVYELVTGDDLRAASNQVAGYSQPEASVREIMGTSISFPEIIDRLLDEIRDLEEFMTDENRPFWYEKIPRDRRDPAEPEGLGDPENWDQRIVLIQKHLNIHAIECQKQAKNTDKGIVEKTIPLKKANFYTGLFDLVVTEVNGLAANLSNTASLLDSEGAPLNDFPLKEFLKCELIPEALEYADGVASITSQTYAPEAQGSDLERFSKTPIESSGKEIQMDVSICDSTPPGSCSNYDPSTHPEQNPEALPSCFGPPYLYCSSNGNCPEACVRGSSAPPLTNRDLEVENEGTDLDNRLSRTTSTGWGSGGTNTQTYEAYAGGGWEFGFMNYMPQRSWLPEVMGFSYPWFCQNLGNSADCTQPRPQPGSTPRPGETNTAINCNQSVPDSALPTQYLGGFKSNVIRICDAWVTSGQNNGAVCYNDLVKQAYDAGVNPTYALSIWANESGCSSYGYTSQVEDFGIHVGPNSTPNNFNVQIQGFINEARSGIQAKKSTPQYSSCFDTSRWPDFEAYMFIYMYGDTYEDFPGNGEAHPELDGVHCSQFSSSTDYWSYYHQISTGYVWQSSSCNFPSSPTDMSCMP